MDADYRNDILFTICMPSIKKQPAGRVLVTRLNQQGERTGFISHIILELNAATIGIPSRIDNTKSIDSTGDQGSDHGSMTSYVGILNSWGLKSVAQAPSQTGIPPEVGKAWQGQISGSTPPWQVPCGKDPADHGFWRAGGPVRDPAGALNESWLVEQAMDRDSGSGSIQQISADLCRQIQM